MAQDTVDAPRTTAKDSSGKPPPSKGFGLREWGRWIWRQLTSMRTALILLFLLSMASIPGSVFPQSRVDPTAVTQFSEENPTLSPLYEKLGMYDVYGSAWFAAIYLALLVSLLGCIIPRTYQHWKALRARPPAAPSRLNRMPEHRRWDSDDEVSEVLESAERTLRARRYRVVREGTSVAAERGYLRETGNLVFHLAIVVVLVGVAIGAAFGFKGTVIVVAGNGFANTITQYDRYESGPLFEGDQLPPFFVRINDFKVKFETGEAQRGSPRNFDADVTSISKPGAQPKSESLTSNHPLEISGAQVHLLSHGYAPNFTVMDGNGDKAYSGPWPFLPQDGTFTSLGVVKAPDAQPDQLAFQGFFLPTAKVDEKRGPHSVFPDAVNPMVFLTAYSGDVGLDDGDPQSVYQLETKGMKQLKDGDEPFAVALTPGKSAKLPDGRGSIRFDGYQRWVNLQVSRNPGEMVALVGSVLALIGVTTSLFVKRRRAWVRVSEGDGRTVVEVAGLDRTEGSDDLASEIDALDAELRGVHAAEPDVDESGVDEDAAEASTTSSRRHESGRDGQA